MANKENTTAIEKKDWRAEFTLVGTAKISDVSFKIDEQSEKSDWIYNSLNLGVNCGEKCGTVYCEMMGGYGKDKQNVIYVHGKNDDGKDDFKNTFTIDFDDRLNETFIADVGDMCFLTVGLEKTSDNKTFYKKFLHEYDAIAYIKENLKNDTVIIVKGDLKYQTYNGKTFVKKQVKSICLSQAKEENYGAKFVQTVLLDKESVSMKEIDKATGIVPVHARVLDYLKVKTNNDEWKGQYPYNMVFNYRFDLTDSVRATTIYETLFKVKKDITQITFEGEIVVIGSKVETSLDDLNDNIMKLLKAGVYTEEEVKTICAGNGSKEQKLILKKPFIKKTEKDGKITVIPQIFEHRFKEDNLIVVLPKDDNDTDNVDSVPFDEDTESGTVDDSMSWLDSLV